MSLSTTLNTASGLAGQQITQQLSKQPRTNTPTSLLSADSKQMDAASFSELGQWALQNHLNIEQSSVTSGFSGYNFDLQFDQEHLQSIHTQGFLDIQQQKLEFDLSFELNASSFEQYRGKNQQLRFDLHFSMENVRVQQAQVHEKKEDIFHFVRRIVKHIADFAASEDFELAELILDDKDAVEIAGLDNGKILKDIAALVTILYAANKFLGRDKTDVSMYLKRDSETELQFSSTWQQKLNFSVSVTAIPDSGTPEKTATDTDTEPTTDDTNTEKDNN